jgi:hypothetical protein
MMFFNNPLNRATTDSNNNNSQQQQQQQQQQQEQENNNIVNDDDDNNNNDVTMQQRIRLGVIQWKNYLRVKLHQITGYEWTDIGISCFSGILLGMFIMTLLILIDLCLVSTISLWNTNTNPNTHESTRIVTSNNSRSTLAITSTIIYWIPYMYQLVGIIALGSELFRRGRGRGQHHQQNSFTRQQQDEKFEQMVALVQTVPLEDFVPQQDDDGDNRNDQNIESYQSIPVSQLKEMLRNRDVPIEEINAFVEKQQLLSRLKKCRQYSDTCCICFESYQHNDPVRVLKKCHHELHVECLDKWVYTFATNPTKLRQQPSCPLCKEILT